MRQTLGERVRKVIADQGLSVRGLARDLAGKGATSSEVDAWRRLIYRVMDDGKVRDGERRTRLAAKLGIDPEEFNLPAAARAGETRIGRLERRMQRLEDAFAEIEQRLPEASALPRQPSASQALPGVGRE